MFAFDTMLIQLGLITLTSASDVGWNHGTHSAVVGWNSTFLSQLQHEIATNGTVRPALRRSLHALQKEAVQALDFKPPSVVTAGGTPFPGTGVTPHDLWILATYAWPCGTPCNRSRFKSCSNWWRRPHYKTPGRDRCDNDTGLPWEEHDGYPQPEGMEDIKASDLMSDAVTQLALAHYLLRNDTFGSQAVRLLKVWFLDDATAMTPNLAHAAIIPGVTNGSSTGIIVTSHRWNSRLTDSMALLHSTGALREPSLSRLHAWNNKYLQWLLGPIGRREANMPQNHATWHTVETAALAASAGDVATAAARLTRLTKDNTPGALGHQILASGLMPLEANRTDGASYSCMNVAALFAAATIGRNLGDPSVPDLFEYQNATGNGTGSIRRALDYLLQFATNKSKPWPWSQATKAPPWTELAPQMLIAATVYGEPRYERMIAELPWDKAGKHWPQEKSWDVAVERLLYPSTID